jgi:DNA-binding beta-propeller fold protein YncE
MSRKSKRLSRSALGLALVLILAGAWSRTQSGSRIPTNQEPQNLPNMGQQITPLAPRDSRFESMNPDLSDYPAWLAGQAVTSVVSPDRKTLLVLTSGYNRVNRTAGAKDPYGTYFSWPDSNEYVFIYDIAARIPVKRQVLRIPNTYNGIVFDPSGAAFYVSGGCDDVIHVMTRKADETWAETTAAMPLGHHKLGNGLAGQSDVGTGSVNLQVGVKPCAAGVALSSDGLTLVAVNYYNDSITVFYGGLGRWSSGVERDLRPGKNDPSQAGVPGGEYPFWAQVKGNGSTATAYVSSLRDREIVVVNIGGTPTVAARIRVKGQPNKMILNAAQTLLYVAEDQTDTVDVIDTARNAVVGTIPIITPASMFSPALMPYTGANTNSVTLSPDETKLLVTNGNLNCVAVAALGGAMGVGRVIGLIPTGWYPNSAGFSDGGEWIYVVNGKSPTGPNPDNFYAYGPPDHRTGSHANQYNPQMIKAGLQSYPCPADGELRALTARVAANNRLAHTTSPRDAAVMAAVRKGIRHVIFIVKENRTYDQILGDLEIGNGDPALAEFGEALTPNQHRLARDFVTLDSFYDTAEVSYDGWLWTTAGRAPDVVERQFPVMYAGRGLSLDNEGTNRSVNVAYATLAGRRAANPLMPDDPDLLPGQTNTSAPDGPGQEINTGYLWDSALRAHLSVRNYGFFLDGTRYAFPPGSPYGIALERDPARTHPPTIVAYPSSASLAPFTDPYFRGFDNAFPDFYRFAEWEREFDARYAREGGAHLPALSLVRFMHDHTGSFDVPPLDGVDTPELQQADNDYAVGLLVQKIARSRYANDTLIFVIEDDAQDGPDHVDSHRSVAFVAGAYVKQGALVSTSYNTIDFLRTIEEVLGLPPMNLNDALGRPMADIFDTTPHPWTFAAAPAPILYGTKLPLPSAAAGLIVPKSTHDVRYWARVTKGMDFTAEDRFNFGRYNRILWTGLKGDKPYPASPTGTDLRRNRRQLLAPQRPSPK